MNFFFLSCSIYTCRWYFGRIGIIGAVNQLKMDCNQCGSYLVRDNETVTSREYQLLVRDKDRVKSYDIKRLENGNFFISEHSTFENIQNLIAHYQQQADGLCSSLMYPCILANDLKPQTAGLSKQTNEEWDIDHRQLVFCRTIGFSQFANILEGVWNGTTPVAIKTLKSNITTDFQEFLLEVTIMRKLRHPNLVQLYAVCTKKEPIYIITELMKDGSLLDYLRGEGRSLKLPQLIDISAQVASGMAYLEEQCYVHKDLAARNVLVENMICKVSDSVIVHAIDDDFCAPEGYTSRIKWTAPEAALYNRYSLKSDVWSYGIVLYEIFTHGRIPYSGMSFGLHDVYERGHRMQKPMDCPDKIYEIMLECWEEEPSARPTFSNLKCFLEDFFLSKDDFWVLLRPNNMQLLSCS